MSQIIIKSEDPIHGMSTKSFGTREEAEAYMDSIGLVKTQSEPEPEPQPEPEVIPEEPEEHKKAILKPEVKHPSKPVVKHSKAKKR